MSYRLSTYWRKVTAHATVASVLKILYCAYLLLCKSLSYLLIIMLLEWIKLHDYNDYMYIDYRVYGKYLLLLPIIC